MEDTQQPVEQQVTSKTPATKQKNPKRVAQGKIIAERTKIAREAQKKALIDAQRIIEQAKIAQAKPPADTPSVDPVASAETTKNVLTTTQLLAIISIAVSLAGVYYKREELKNILSKKAVPPPRTPPPSPVLTRAPPARMRQMD